MENSKHLKYLAVSQQDLLWGLAVNSVGFQNIAPGMSYPPQDHPSRYVFSTDKGRVLNEYQLVYITRGGGRFASSSIGHSVSVSEGDLLMLFPGEWHTYSPDSDSGWKEFWIGFQGEMADTLMSKGFISKSKPIFDVGIHDDIVGLYDSAIRIAEEGKSSFQQTLSAIALHIMSLAYYYDKNRSFKDSGLMEKIEKAKAIVASQYSNIDAEGLAEMLCISYSGFRKAFKQYTGFSPAKYILEVRFSKVKEELTNTNKSIKEIAWSLGYQNYDNFLTSFKSHSGMTPLEYRDMTTGHKA